MRSGEMIALSDFLTISRIILTKMQCGKYQKKLSQGVKINDLIYTIYFKKHTENGRNLI